MKRRKNLYFGLGPAPTPTKRERARQKKEFQSGVRRKRRAFKGQREKEASTLFKQLQRDAKPQRAHKTKMSPGDEERWRELLRANPLGLSELVSFAEQLKGANVAKKRKKRKKNSRKGVMPAGLRKYWAKKRAKKNKRKNPKKRPRAKVRRPRRRKAVRARVRRRRPAVRRAKRRNPPRRRRVKIIKTSLTGKKLRQFRAAMSAKYHAPARII